MWTPSAKKLYGRTSTFGTSVMPLDGTEELLHKTGQIAKDFELALADTTSVAKCIQLRERVTACIAVLVAVERAGFDKTDRLSEAKD